MGLGRRGAPPVSCHGRPYPSPKWLPATDQLVPAVPHRTSGAQLTTPRRGDEADVWPHTQSGSVPHQPPAPQRPSAATGLDAPDADAEDCAASSAEPRRYATPGPRRPSTPTSTAPGSLPDRPSPNGTTPFSPAAPAFLSFQTVAGLRSGALLRGWGVPRLQRLKRRSHAPRSSTREPTSSAPTPSCGPPENRLGPPSARVTTTPTAGSQPPRSASASRWCRTTASLKEPPGSSSRPCGPEANRPTTLFCLRRQAPSRRLSRRLNQRPGTTGASDDAQRPVGTDRAAAPADAIRRARNKLLSASR